MAIEDEDELSAAVIAERLTHHVTQMELWTTGRRSYTNSAEPAEDPNVFVQVAIADALQAQAHAAAAQVYATMIDVLGEID